MKAHDKCRDNAILVMHHKRGGGFDGYFLRLFEDIIIKNFGRNWL
jgi:hypothetical protein